MGIFESGAMVNRVSDGSVGARSGPQAGQGGVLCWQFGKLPMAPTQQILSPNTRCVRGNTPCMHDKSI